MRRRKIVPVVMGAVVAVGGLYAFAALRYSSKCSSPRSSCLEHRKAGCSISGDYNIALGDRTIDATCDMDTDGGGWTLVGNYLHKASTGGSLVPFQDRLPVQKGTQLGANEQNSPSWGHAGVRVLAGVPFNEFRFFCRTSAHTRTLDFKINAPSCLEYFRTGRGSCMGTPELRAEFQANTHRIGSHDGRLLLAADKGWSNQGDNAPFLRPFFAEVRSGWTAGDRWECDDWQTMDRQDTRHQIWIR